MNKLATGRPPKAVAEPSVFDILMGRYGYCYNHVGNQSFRTLIDDNLGWYASVMNARKREKMAVVSSIMNTIEEGGGKFLRQSPYDLKFYEVNYKTAREKISHALRDHLAHKPALCRPKKDALQVNSESKEGDQWRGLVLKTFKLYRDRHASKTSAMDLPTVQLGEGGITLNQAHSVDQHCDPRHERKQLEVSLEESRAWFRSFASDTLHESKRANTAVTRPVGTDQRSSSVGSGPNAARPSSMDGSNNISLEPLPTSPECLTSSGMTPTKPVNSKRNKVLQNHCTRSIELNNRDVTKKSPAPMKASTTMMKPRDCSSPVAPTTSPCGAVPPNVITPLQGPRPPPKESLAQPEPDVLLTRLPKQGLRPPSKESLTQPLPNKSLLPRLVSVESQSCDVDVGSSEYPCSKANNDDSASSRKTFSNAEPTKPDETGFASLFKDIQLCEEEEEGASSNHDSFASVDSTCENAQCFCRSNDIEPLPVDFDSSIDLEKLMTGLLNTEGMHGSSKSYTDQELDGMITDLFQA